jgi:hypothetical protein
LAQRSKIDGWIIALAAVFSIIYLALSYATSYQHLYILGLATGQSGADARMTPLTLDLPILVLSLAVLLAVRLGAAVPKWLWASLWFGVIATVGANFYFGWHWGVVGALMSAVPAAFLAIVVESTIYMLRIAAEAREKADRQVKLNVRGQKIAETKRARRGDSEAVQGQPQTVPALPPWEGQGNALAPTGAFPAQSPVLTGIGLNGRQN